MTHASATQLGKLRGWPRRWHVRRCAYGCPVRAPAGALPNVVGADSPPDWCRAHPDMTQLPHAYVQLPCHSQPEGVIGMVGGLGILVAVLTWGRRSGRRRGKCWRLSAASCRPPTPGAAGPPRCWVHWARWWRLCGTCTGLRAGESAEVRYVYADGDGDVHRGRERREPRSPSGGWLPIRLPNPASGRPRTIVSTPKAPEPAGQRPSLAVGDTGIEPVTSSVRTRMRRFDYQHGGRLPLVVVPGRTVLRDLVPGGPDQVGVREPARGQVPLGASCHAAGGPNGGGYWPCSSRLARARRRRDSGSHDVSCAKARIEPGWRRPGTSCRTWMDGTRSIGVRLADGTPTRASTVGAGSAIMSGGLRESINGGGDERFQAE
jgi:hypothetical protein